MLDKLEEMINLQEKLNTATCGENWHSALTKEGRKIDFARCIYMECAEFIDSMPWKHWKSINAKTDYENLKIELVDIWHFILSLAIMQKDVKILKESFKQFDFNAKYDDDLDSILENSRILIHISSAKEVEIDKLINIFFTLCMQGKLEFAWLYKLYIGKNVLNQFRQDNGYKAGTYKKIWSGKEDNIVMLEQLDDDINYDSLYKKLLAIYEREK